MRGSPRHFCEIVFEERPYWSGCVVSGHVELFTREKPVLLDCLSVAFLGTVNWTTQETSYHTNSDGSTSSSTTTVNHEHKFVELNQVLIPVKKGGKIQINPSESRWRFPFSFQLPQEGLHPSCPGDPGINYR